jgi:Zn-dependent protease with chaperone function
MFIKNYSLKKKIFIGLLLFGAISAFPIYKTFIAKPKNQLAIFIDLPTETEIKETVQSITAEKSSVTQMLAQQLQEEYDQLFANIQKEFPSEQWESLKAVLENIKSKDQLLTDNPIVVENNKDHPFVTIIKKTLASYNIDPSKVAIEIVDTPQSFMAAGQGFEKGSVRHLIRINLSAIAKKSDDVLLAFLKHEIMHLLNYDGITGMFIKDLLKKNGITQDQISQSPSLIAFKKFQEYRADLLAADNPETAQSLIKDFEKIIELHPNEQTNPTHSTHPTETQRKQAITQLLTYLNVENELKIV